MHFPAESYLPFLQNPSTFPVLVIGDLMLDRYLWGKVERISPEAPVPVVDVTEEESRLGGAANVALNLLALGAKPILCGVIGNDSDGDLLLEEMQKLGLPEKGILRLNSRRTTAKIRILGNRHQMLRVDKEVKDVLHAEDSALLESRILEILPQVKGIIFEDYDKGLITPLLIEKISVAAGKLNLPVFVDPKYRNFSAYSNCTVFKPNLKELNEGLGLRLQATDTEGIVQAIKAFRKKMPHTWTLLTLSEHGMLLIDADFQALHIPAHARSIADVSGAGDTVISVLAFASIAGLSIPAASTLANLAGGLVCEKPGVVPVEIPELIRDLEKLRGLSLHETR